METPFCHGFIVDDSPYIYVVNSGDVFAVDPATAAVLDETAPVMPGERLSEAQARVNEAREEQGLFSFHRPRALSPCSTCHAPEGYDGHVEQLTLSVSEQCNLRCRYCLHGNGLDWVRSHRDRCMSGPTAFAAVREFLRRSRNIATPSISFYGGEPLLEFDLIRDIVDLVRREGPCADYRFNIDTNGTRLDDAVIEFILREKIHLQVSLDGPADIHDRHRRFRGGGPTHAEIMSGVARLLAASREAHELLRFQVTLSPPGEIERIGAYFADFPPYSDAGCEEVPSVGVNLVNLAGADLDELAITETDQAAMRDDLDQSRRRYITTRLDGREPDPILSALFEDGLISYYHRSRAPLDDVISPGGCCRPGQRRLHVCADGAYQPCERVGSGLVIGNTKRGLDLEAVDVLWERFTGTFVDRCLDCWACRLCPVCFTALAESWGGVAMREEDIDRVCGSARNQLEQTLRTYVELVKGNLQSLDFLKQTTVS